jgi:hypothetical protein
MYAAVLTTVDNDILTTVFCQLSPKIPARFCRKICVWLELLATIANLINLTDLLCK